MCINVAWELVAWDGTWQWYNCGGGDVTRVVPGRLRSGGVSLLFGSLLGAADYRKQPGRQDLSARAVVHCTHRWSVYLRPVHLDCAPDRILRHEAPWRGTIHTGVGTRCKGCAAVAVNVVGVHRAARNEEHVRRRGGTVVSDSEGIGRQSRSILAAVQTEGRKHGPMLVWWTSCEATTVHA